MKSSPSRAEPHQAQLQSTTPPAIHRLLQTLRTSRVSTCEPTPLTTRLKYSALSPVATHLKK
jgi:hypothetical protein